MDIMAPGRAAALPLAAVLLSIIATLVPASSATADSPGQRPGDPRTLVALDYAAGEHPEGLAAARDGSLYAGMAPTGQLLRVAPDGHTTTLGAPAFPEGAGYLLGLAVDGRERVYGAVVRFDGGPSGVWRFDRGTGTWDLFAATDPSGFPNGLAFTDDGTLLVSDMTLGTIWAVDPDGRVSTWLHDPALEGGANDAGVNGLALDRAGDVWFTNSDRGVVGEIAVDGSGAPVGAPRTVARGPLLSFADGLALDTAGNAWVAASYGADRLLRVDPRGTVTPVLDRSDGLDYTASVAFGRRPGTRRTLSFTNSGDDFGEPSVMALETTAPGLALRYP